MAFAILHCPIALSNVARQHIHAPDLRKYRTELPNLVDDMGLGPYEFRLLVHYYRVGDCWESTRTTARKCAMSVGKVSEARRGLERRKLIEIGDNAQGTLQINVVDIWPQNFQNYAERAKKKSIRRTGKAVPPTRSKREKARAPSKAKGARGGEEDIRREVEQRFIELSRLRPPSRQGEARELWVYPLREICKLADWDEGRATLLIEKSLERLRENGLTISSPKSILKTARAIAAEMETGPAKGRREKAKDWESRVFGD